jgi:carbon dioxide concentrating mechanism protein CcmO
MPRAFAFLEIANLTPSLVVADRCAKAAGVELVGIESTMGAEQTIKLAGSVADVRAAADAGVELARRMGSEATLVLIPGPDEGTEAVSTQPPAYIPLLDIYDLRAKREQHMANPDALGLIETQGLVAALHATDAMLKASAVTLVGKEKIVAAYVTIVVRGDVAAVQAAVEAGRQTVLKLEGKLIMADVITRPHPELLALLPAM